MHLKFVELDLEWLVSKKTSLMRNFIRNKLLFYGEPLRWSITSIKKSSSKKDYLTLRIDAVLIID